MSVATITSRSPRYVDPNSALAKQIENFQALMNDPPENSRVITFTPALAAWILERYNKEKGNRKKKPTRIRRYATAMGARNWLMTGETIIFSKTRLLNGQNRLMACVQASQRFVTHVVFGIEDGVFTALDSGKSRTSGDMFFTAGVPDSAIVSSAVRWLMIYTSGNPMDRSSPSNQDAWTFWQDKVDRPALELAITRSKQASKVLHRGVLAAHLYMFAQKSEKTAAKLAGDFDHNRGSAKKLTIHIARTRKTNQGRLNDTWLNAMIVKTWNAYRANQTVTARDLKWNPETQEYPNID